MMRATRLPSRPAIVLATALAIGLIGLPALCVLIRGSAEWLFSHYSECFLPLLPWVATLNAPIVRLHPLDDPLSRALRWYADRWR